MLMLMPMAGAEMPKSACVDPLLSMEQALAHAKRVWPTDGPAPALKVICKVQQCDGTESLSDVFRAIMAEPDAFFTGLRDEWKLSSIVKNLGKLMMFIEHEPFAQHLRDALGVAGHAELVQLLLARKQAADHERNHPTRANEHTADASPVLMGADPMHAHPPPSPSSEDEPWVVTTEDPDRRPPSERPPPSKNALDALARHSHLLNTLSTQLSKMPTPDPMAVTQTQARASMVFAADLVQVVADFIRKMADP